MPQMKAQHQKIANPLGRYARGGATARRLHYGASDGARKPAPGAGIYEWTRAGRVELHDRVCTLLSPPWRAIRDPRWRCR
jgi:hypothetical protein